VKFLGPPPVRGTNQFEPSGWPGSPEGYFQFVRRCCLARRGLCFYQGPLCKGPRPTSGVRRANLAPRVVVAFARRSGRSGACRVLGRRCDLQGRYSCIGAKARARSSFSALGRFQTAFRLRLLGRGGFTEKVGRSEM